MSLLSIAFDPKTGQAERSIHLRRRALFMTQTLPIIAFDFANEPADQDRLIQAWLPEIEQQAIHHVPDDRFISFLIAALRLGARSKTLEGFNMMQLVQKAGYSRSTFFRLFEGYTSFLLKGYQLTCSLSTKAYETHLNERTLNLDEFCAFTADVFYGANCTIPNEIIQMLWKEHDLTQEAFHPHLADLAPIMHRYLKGNEATQHLDIDLEEFAGVLKTLDLAILNARLNDDPDWGTPYFYKKLHKMLKGYLLSNT